MKRKINLVGQNTLTVSLPRKWTKEQDLRKGDDIEVEENGKELIISANPRESIQKIELNLNKENEWYINQVIRAVYMAGFDEVTVHYKDNEVISTVQDVLGICLGYQIVEHKDRCFVIKNLSSGIEAELDFVLRRIFMMVKALIEMSIEHIAKKDYNFKAIKAMRDNIYRFCNLYRRTITKKRSLSLTKHESIYILVTRMAMISNNILDAHRYLQKTKSAISLDYSCKYLKKVLAQYELFCEAFYSKKFDKMAEVNKMRQELMDREFVSLAENSKGSNVVLCHYFAEMSRLIATSTGLIVKYHWMK